MTAKTEKMDILEKHIGKEEFYYMNGEPILIQILDAMEEYHQQKTADLIKAITELRDGYAELCEHSGYRSRLITELVVDRLNKLLEEAK